MSESRPTLTQVSTRTEIGTKHVGKNPLHSSISYASCRHSSVYFPDISSNLNSMFMYIYSRQCEKENWFSSSVYLVIHIHVYVASVLNRTCTFLYFVSSRITKNYFSSRKGNNYLASIALSRIDVILGNVMRARFYTCYVHQPHTVIRFEHPKKLHLYSHYFIRVSNLILKKLYRVGPILKERISRLKVGSRTNNFKMAARLKLAVTDSGVYSPMHSSNPSWRCRAYNLLE